MRLHLAAAVRRCKYFIARSLASGKEQKARAQNLLCFHLNLIFYIAGPNTAEGRALPRDAL